MSNFSFAKQFNQGARFDFEIPESHEYIDMKVAAHQNGYDAIYTLLGCFINTKNTKYGESVTLVAENFLLNAPQHLADTIKEVRNNPDAVEAINKGKVGFKLYPYNNQYGEQVGVEFIDL